MTQQSKFDFTVLVVLWRQTLLLTPNYEHRSTLNTEVKLLKIILMLMYLQANWYPRMFPQV